MKIAAFCLLSLMAGTAAADYVPLPVLFGSGSHTWIQHGLLVTVRSMDFAINGSGFFVLADAQGQLYTTRHGDFAVDSDGFIVYRSTGYRLLSARRTPINVAAAVKTPDGATGKAFRVDIDGKLSFAYSDGTVRTLNDRIGLALIDGDKVMPRTGHLFPVRDQETLYIGNAGDDARGQMFQFSLEELDAHAYFLFENNTDVPSDVADGYEVEAEGKFDHGGLSLATKRVRLVAAKDEWWQLSADDRLIWYGKLAVENAVVTFKSMTLPADYSCTPTETTLSFKEGHGAELTAESSDCNWSMRVHVRKIPKSERTISAEAELVPN